MTTQARIENAISKAKTIAYGWADKWIADNSTGDYEICCQLKLLLLNKWITILDDYLNQNFADDTAVTPTYPCTTLADINLLIGKINALECL